MAPGGEGGPRNSGAGPGPGSAGAPPGADADAGAGAGWSVPGDPLGWRELGGLAGACAVRGPLGLEGALAPGGAWVSLLLGGLLTPLWQAPLAALTAELGTSPDLAGAGGSVEWVRRTQGPGVTAAVAVATVLGSCAWAAQAGLLLSETASLTLAGGYGSTSATAVAIASEKGGEGRAGPCPSPAACAALFALVVVAALAPNLWGGGAASPGSVSQVPRPSWLPMLCSSSRFCRRLPYSSAVDSLAGRPVCSGPAHSGHQLICTQGMTASQCSPRTKWPPEKKRYRACCACHSW